LLSGDPQDQLVIAYNLVVDNKRIADETAKLEIRDFFLASSPPSESYMSVGAAIRGKEEESARGNEEEGQGRMRGGPPERR